MKTVKFQPKKNDKLYKIIQSANLINSILDEIRQIANQTQIANKEARK